MPTTPSRPAIAFDFDGTLIHGGKLNNDKSIHIMYSTWVALHEHALTRFLRPRALRSDVAQMTRAYIRYPGAPRFQQFAAVANALVNRKYDAVESFDELGIDETFRAGYEAARARYNELYSTINDAAAERYWKPYPSVKGVLRSLARRHDLYIASGVTQDILQADFDRHRFDRRLFQAISGGNAKGGSDKGTLLQGIKARGHDRVIFVADSNKDLEYARFARVEFYRIRNDADFARLPKALGGPLPSVRKWSFTSGELRFMRTKTLGLLERYVAGKAMTPAQVTRWINA